jgi:hypothetical protein
VADRQTSMVVVPVYHDLGQPHAVVDGQKNRGRTGAEPGLQYARSAVGRVNVFSIFSDSFSNVLSPGAAYWPKLNGWRSHDPVGTGVSAAAAAAVVVSRLLRFSCSANVADPPG